MTFEQWMAEVDRILTEKLGLKHTDLADRNWLDAFADGIDAHAEVIEALLDEGYTFDDDNND